MVSIYVIRRSAKTIHIDEYIEDMLPI